MITFVREPDGTIVLTAKQVLPLPRDEVFPFFANAHNLELLTPPSLGFKILTSTRELEMREGLLIDYRIRMRGIPMRWRTRIAVWNPPIELVDEQLRGPYALWHHTHRFEAITPESGPPATRMIDVVRYRPPMGSIVGGIANRLFVRRELQAIFTFRREAVTRLLQTPTFAGLSD